MADLLKTNSTRHRLTLATPESTRRLRGGETFIRRDKTDPPCHRPAPKPHPKEDVMKKWLLMAVVLGAGSLSMLPSSASANTYCRTVCTNVQRCFNTTRCYQRRYCYPQTRCGLSRVCAWSGDYQVCRYVRNCNTYTNCSYRNHCYPVQRCRTRPVCVQRCDYY